MGLDTVGAQSRPVPGRDSVTDAVISDLTLRREGGIKKYGRELQTHNGRSFLIDAYQETLDAALYLRGAIIEDDHKAAAVHDLENARAKVALILPQVKDKWVLADIELLIARAIQKLTPPQPEPSPSSPGASEF